LKGAPECCFPLGVERTRPRLLRPSRVRSRSFLCPGVYPGWPHIVPLPLCFGVQRQTNVPSPAALFFPLLSRLSRRSVHGTCASGRRVRALTGQVGGRRSRARRRASGSSRSTARCAFPLLAYEFDFLVMLFLAHLVSGLLSFLTFPPYVMRCDVM